MPIFQVDIQKNLDTEYWTNVYHVQAADRAEAATIADDILSAERSIHQTRVVFPSMRIAPYPGPSEGTIVVVGLTGGAPNDPYLPLFNVLRVDFSTPVGRPSRKYYRIPIPESVQENGVLSTSFQTDFSTAYNLAMAPLYGGQLVDVDGQPLTFGRLIPNVGMRQLRRGSKRRLEPVIPLA